jgi:hypothetical protein
MRFAKRVSRRLSPFRPEGSAYRGPPYCATGPRRDPSRNFRVQCVRLLGSIYILNPMRGLSVATEPAIADFIIYARRNS